jgi:hypothetical protein
MLIHICIYISIDIGTHIHLYMNMCTHINLRETRPVNRDIMKSPLTSLRGDIRLIPLKQILLTGNATTNMLSTSGRNSDTDKLYHTGNNLTRPDLSLPCESICHSSLGWAPNICLAQTNLFVT